jgi:hypothetical protein
MNLRARLFQLWEEVRGLPPVAPPVQTPMAGPEDDPADTIVILDRQQDQPNWQAQPITGHSMEIVYRDSRGQLSERQIVCHRLESYSGGTHLVARCALRGAQRTFRVDRIEQAVLSVTGEVFEPGTALLDVYAIDRESSGRFRFGLPPRKFALFNAALNVLVFVARCDGKWHPLEFEAIESFVMACWLRLDFPGDLDLAAVAAHVGRLTPDAEVLWTSVDAVAANPAMAALVRRHLVSVIDADGVHHPREVWFASQIAEVLEP